jgi:hypothetical protein
MEARRREKPIGKAPPSCESPGFLGKDRCHTNLPPAFRLVAMPASQAGFAGLPHATAQELHRRCTVADSSSEPVLTLPCVYVCSGIIAIAEPPPDARRSPDGP